MPYSCPRQEYSPTKTLKDCQFKIGVFLFLLIGVATESGGETLKIHE